jgi:hypothetical protein
MFCEANTGCQHFFYTHSKSYYILTMLFQGAKNIIKKLFAGRSTFVTSLYLPTGLQMQFPVLAGTRSDQQLLSPVFALPDKLYQRMQNKKQHLPGLWV